MTQNEMSAVAIAIFIGFAVLRGIFRMLRNLARGDTSRMDRIDAAARKVLAEQQQAMRSSPVPATDRKATDGKARLARTAMGTPAKPKPQRPARTAAMQKSQSASAALLSKTRTPAIVRPGLLTGKEPVIQRRR